MFCISACLFLCVAGAMLPVEGGKQGITLLFKPGTHEESGCTSFCIALAFYFILGC